MLKLTMRMMNNVMNELLGHATAKSLEDFAKLHRQIAGNLERRVSMKI